MKMFNFLFSLSIIVVTTATISAQDTTNDLWKNNGANKVYVDNGVKVGIGMNNPATHLFMQSSNKFGLSLNGAANGWSTIGSNWAASKVTAGAASILQFTPGGSIWFRTNKNKTTTANNGWDTPLRMFTGGFVVVGSSDENLTKDNNGNILTDYKLFVKDGILTEKVKVAISTTNDWSDFVFADDYDLNSIETVEAFVKENKHLPNIPSAEAVVEQGVNVAEMDAKLLRQIEELWLQMIDLNKKVKGLEVENEALESKVSELENN